ncbi:methyltransferase domain-containing protein [Photobacterium phosphoreum]|uniref:Methyltransferase domain-containing protein n=1 Tax=Photobacterium phosphoreum TaxID=659 RepID=A0AAW4ZSW1_PHOPO|nr:methyltransferase domain-containing protein [Photobacterium phosphoreum]MCD9489828.1 methyltransferase domain-containing protein [Photobacterium phosphoreum]MCF2189094.1 methyltransferase domain-containing protein [Photobacterium phosphoreum]MCF2301191.1 methyltransferase domain-containing protein [Photobacterium phosphoreum]
MLGYYLHTKNAQQVLDAIGKRLSSVRISTDLNLTEQDFVVTDQGLILDEDNQLSIADLKKIVKKTQRIYLCSDGDMEPIEDRSVGYYKLAPTEGAPLLEISGVKMHISKGTDPFASASGMAKQAVRSGDNVLDCCSGLGYAAIAAHRLGAKKVLTIELSESVMGLRALNPWSRDLNNAGIEQRQGSSFELITTMPSMSFDAVIHDPPRFSLAGELYSEEFYGEIYRVLRQDGRLFHYTGNPHIMKKGSGFVDGVIRRLKAVGFKNIHKVDHLMGVSAQK